MEGTPNILEIENAIIALLEEPLKALNVRTYGFPEDWTESGRNFVKNSAIVSFAGMDLTEPNSAGIARSCVPTYQLINWSFNVLLITQKLSCGNPSNPAIYDVIDTIKREVCGQRPFPDAGPIWASSVDYTGRESGFWMFTVSLNLNLDGKEACTDNALLAPYAPMP